MHRTLELPIGCYDFAVNSQHDITIFKNIGGRRVCNNPHDAQRAATGRIVFLKSFQPVFVNAKFACGKQGCVDEFRLERIERSVLSYGLQKLLDDFAANAAIDLRIIAAGLYDETRPARGDTSLVVNQHAIVVRRRRDQVDAFDIRIPKPQGPRQRQ